MKKYSIALMLAAMATCGIWGADIAKNPVDANLIEERAKVIEARAKAAEKRGIIQIRMIVHAIFDYQTKNGRFPRTLADLVADKHLEPGVIFMKQADKGLISPVYYPDSASTQDPGNTPLLTYRSKDQGRGIVARWDGSVVFQKTEAEQVEDADAE